MITSDVALKEWALVTEALASGEQVVIVRKGGIRDPHGSFQLEHREFFIYPTTEHQNEEAVRPEFRGRFSAAADPKTVLLKVYAEVAFCVEIKELKQLLGLEKYHIWTPEFFQKRMEYKPNESAWLAVLKAYRLAEPILQPVMPEYAGCKSWVKLSEPVQMLMHEPVIDDRRFLALSEEISSRFLR